MDLSERGDGTLIVFLDLETTYPVRAIIEFGAILVCSRTLVEIDSYSTLVRPADPSLLSTDFKRNNGITRDAVAAAPPFADVAHQVFELLHGHNILNFDLPLIKEAFAKIGWQLPEPKRIIDTYPFLSQTFGKRAGNMQLETLASYFQLGPQMHRSLDDARMNLQVLKDCGAVLFLESSFPDMLVNDGWVSPDDVSIPSISASLSPFYHGSSKIQIFHEDVSLKLLCTDLKLRFPISKKFTDKFGRPRLSFVVDAPPRLYQVLNECNNQAESLFQQSGSTSEWKPVIKNYSNSPTVRLHIPTTRSGGVAKFSTKICLKEASNEQDLQLTDPSAEELETWFIPGTSIDAFFFIDTYDYEPTQNAGIRLVAEKLVIIS